MSRPLLSVILPVFQGKSFLREAVQSLLAEGLSSCEILVVDDGSSDGSLSTLSDLPVVCHRLEKNRGTAAAQNFGLEKARGEYITFLDQDDVLVRNGLKWRLQWLMTHPHFGGVFGIAAGVISKDGSLLGEFDTVLGATTPLYSEVLTINSVREGFNLSQTAMGLSLLRRSAIQLAGYFDETLRAAHDREFLFRLLESTQIQFIPKPVYYYRLHDHNLSYRWGERGAEPRPQALAEVFLVHAQYRVPIVAQGRVPFSNS